MKVVILQWVREHDSIHGTIERISTTAADCVKFFKLQMDSLGYNSFKASEEGQLALVDEEKYCQFPDFVIRDYGKLRQFIQSRIDADMLGNLSILAYNKRVGDSQKWFSLQFRNIH